MSSVTPFCGRQAEIEQLSRALDQATTYETPISVLVVGEQGIGKSRLVSRWIERLREQACEVRVLSACAGPNDAPGALISRLLAQRFAKEQGDVAALRPQFEAVVGDRRVAEFLHFLAPFLAIEPPDNAFVRALREDPTEYARIGRMVLRRFIELDAARGPLILVADGLERADDESLSILYEFAEQLQGAPVMIVGCARPQLMVAHRDYAKFEGEHVRIELQPFDDQEVLALCRQLLPGLSPLPDALADAVLQSTAGSPLFVERFVSSLVAERVVTRDGDRWQVDHDRLDDVELPVSVQDAVAIRIAVLERREREVLERAAILGSVFWRGALACMQRFEQSAAGQPIWPIDAAEEQLDPTLAELAERDYILALPDTSIAGEPEYAFKHNLERELLYDRIAPQSRARYHRQVAQWLETRLRTRNEDQLELLGQHFELGGASQRAAYCYLRAGAQARQRFSNMRALTFLRRGISLLTNDDAPAKIDGLRTLIAICEELARPEEASRCAEEMLQIAWLFGELHHASDALRSLGRLARTRGEMTLAREQLMRALALLPQEGAARRVAATHEELGQVAWAEGDYPEALSQHQRALELRRHGDDQSLVARSLIRIGRVRFDAGNFEMAATRIEEALSIYRALNDKAGVIESFVALGSVHRAQSKYQRAFELWTNALHIAHETENRLSEARILVRLGEAASQLGRVREAEGQLDRAAGLAEELGNQALLIEAKRALSETYLALEKIDQAREVAEQSVGLATQLGLRPQRARALRALANVEAARNEEGPRVRAQQMFAEAIELFEEIGSYPELARTLYAQADLFDRSGAWKEADSCRKRADGLKH
ncbi:MAG: tetratricopeptide repeat protein [Deltaproteobacteria bacterium]|nr:tetratricopeptide repeat protein [Deltaproteobacteria bacterium]